MDVAVGGYHKLRLENGMDQALSIGLSTEGVLASIGATLRRTKESTHLVVSNRGQDRGPASSAGYKTSPRAVSMALRSVFGPRKVFRWGRAPDGRISVASRSSHASCSSIVANIKLRASNSVRDARSMDSTSGVILRPQMSSFRSLGRRAPSNAVDTSMTS